jgi:hypothetical protein
VRLRVLVPAVLLAGLGAAAPEARAVTRLEGEYQLMLDARKDQRYFPWDFDSNNNDNYDGAQLRLFTTPRRNTEAFLKIEADWKSPENDTPRPNLQFREAHLRYQWDVRPNQGVESYLFFRQDRFWADSYLIRLVNTGIAKNDRYGANGSGIRVNTWGLLGANATFIASDFADQFNPASGTGTPMRTDDAYIARIRREFLDKSLRVGFGFNRKEENQLGERIEKASVYAFDTRYQWKGVDYSLEYAFSRSPLTAAELSFPDDWTGGISKRGVAIAEIRSFRMGNAKTGYLNFAPTGWIRGPLYDNRLDDSGRDEVGVNLNGWYLLPERAITLTANYRDFQKTTTEKKREREAYAEAYIEFVKGFTGKTYYRERDIVRNISGRTTIEEHDDLFGELQVESRLAWLRIQAKLKDKGLESQKELFNLDTAVNLSDRLKVYNRFSFGSDPAILRKGIFMQLQYRPTGNVEMFLEYGPSWIGDDSTPVNDGDLEGGGDQVDLVKFIIKGQF